MVIYYTYCSYETDKGDSGLMYIGFRKCPKGRTPWTDNYFGTPSSPKNLEFKENPNKGKVILGIFDDKEEALAHEIELHEFYDVARNPRFANQAKQTGIGFSRVGLPGIPSMKGKKHKIETRQKMSEGRRGKNNPNYGKTWKDSPETREKKSKAAAGENNPMYGKNHSECTKEKMRGPRSSIAGKNNPNYGKTWKDSPETREKKSKAMAGKNHHNYDPTLYNFENKELGIVEMQVTRYELMKKYDLLSPKLGAVLKGERKSHKGWKLL